MADRLLVGTRKGLFHLTREGGGAWLPHRHDFPGVAVTAVAADGRDDTLYAALNHGHFGVKLHRSEDAGRHWTELPAPAFPITVPEADGQPSVDQIWVLEPAGPDAPQVLWAGTIPGGLFRSADRGESWQLVESLWNCEERQSHWMGGGAESPGIHSIALDPRDSRRLTLGVSCGGLWQTEDDGTSWTQIGQGMFARYMPDERRNDPRIQDPHRVVRCAADPSRVWIQHHNGVFRSDDGGITCHHVTGLPLSDFGFAVAVHPDDPDTAWFVPGESDEIRIPQGGQFGVSCTHDGGRSFEWQTQGLPGQPAYDLVWRHALDVAADGATLAMGSTTGGLWTTADGGREWQAVAARLPPIACVRFAG